MKTECEVCGREKGDPKASYVWRNAEEMNRLCHRRAGDTWGRAADCYSRGYTRLRSALADAERALRLLVDTAVVSRSPLQFVCPTAFEPAVRAAITALSPAEGQPPEGGK